MSYISVPIVEPYTPCPDFWVGRSSNFKVGISRRKSHGAEIYKSCMFKVLQLMSPDLYGISHSEEHPPLALSLVKMEMLGRLEEFNNLEENWDGYGSPAIETASYRNAKAMIEHASSTLLSKWNLFPATNGTLIMNTKDDTIGSFSIGNSSFSYVAVGHDGTRVKGKKPYDIVSVISALEEINSILGYE